MPIEFKEGLSFSKVYREAAKRRAADEEYRNLSQAELDQRTEAVLQLLDARPGGPPLTAGTPLSAASWADYMRSIKMTVSVMASQSEYVEEEISVSRDRNFATLDDIQREALALDAAVTEEEIKINGRWSEVHFNTFTRPEDSPLPYDDSNWLVDYKTGLPFQPDNMSDMIPGVGLTLPLRQQIDVPIMKVELVGEETDVGDSERPIVSNDPNNLLRNDRTFRHVIIRRDHDKTSRKYNYTPSFCTLLLTFASVQLVNSLELRPVGQSTVYIESLSYINEVGEEVQLTEIEIPSETYVSVLFEPVRTKSMKIKLRQYAPITRTSYEAGDIRVRELNKLLRGSGFTQLLTENTDTIQGRVYDFSLEKVSAALRIYEATGVFRSQPIETTAPIGIAYSDQVETIQISNDNRAYGTRFFLDEGEVLLERYIGVDLSWPEGGQAFRELVPVPDARTQQREFLPIFSGEAKVKLFPDIFWNVVQSQIRDIVWSEDGVATVAFVNAHEFDRTVGEKQTDRLWIISGPGEQANGFTFSSVQWFVIDDQTLEIVPEGTAGSGTLSGAKITPYAFIEGAQDNPVSVYKEEQLLTLGTDYEVSLDRGSTWLTSWPRDGSWSTVRSKAAAGKFRIRLTSPDHNAVYWVDYRPLGSQRLSRRPGVRLRNGRVVFDKRFSDASGTITTVIVSRADNVNPYLTPVLLSYLMRVRENVS